MVKKERNSSIEILKIFAIMLIVFSHAMPFYSQNYIGYMDLTLATESVQRFVIVLLRYGGGIGNVIFIISSSWFLIDDRELNKKKAWLIVCDTFSVSVIMFLIFTAFGVRISKLEVIKQFFPITFQTNWFICCYLLVYLIHPALNQILRNLKQKQHLTISIGMFFVYGILTFVYESTYFYTNFMGYIMIYVLVAYIKNFSKEFSSNLKKNIILFWTSGVLLLLLVAVTNYLGLHFSFFENKLLYWESFKNPLIILMGISSFDLAKNKYFVNKSINYVSSLSLLIYLIHENYIFARYIRASLYFVIYTKFSYQYELLWVCGVAIALMCIGLLGGIVYKQSIGRGVQCVGNKLYCNATRLWSRCTDLIIKIM